MAGLFNYGRWTAVLGLAVGRIACAGTIDMPQAGSSALLGGNALFSQFSRSPQSSPPLRLVLALNREKQHGAALPSERMQEHAAIQSIAYPRASHADDLAFAPPAVDTVNSASDRSPLQPPLQLALALSKNKLRAAPKPIAAAPEPTRQLEEQAASDNPPQQQTTDKPSVDPTPLWEIAPSDRTLTMTLARWSAKAGWQLVWDMEVDYPIETRTVLQGTFQEAVTTVAQSLAGASVPVQATFYEGNRVLRFIAKGSK